LTVEEAAEVFNTKPRFVRRLIEERRITVVRLGRHVRIPETAVRDFIAAGTVQPITARRDGRHLKAVA
jgi:excisionase family DNA binding protein